MDLRFSAEENAFRDKLRTFFREQGAGLHPQQGDGGPPPRQGRQGHRRTRSLHAEGLAVPHWPKEWGGSDWSPVQHYIYTEELQYNGVPQPLPFNVSMCGPVIIAFGTEEQKKRFLPRMAVARRLVVPGLLRAGRRLRSRGAHDHGRAQGRPLRRQRPEDLDHAGAVRRLDLLPRAAPIPRAKKQLGISFLLIDMKTPGITVRPIQTMDGGREVNEVFFDDVKVPVENLVGQENRGWDCAKFLLGNERTGIARVGYSKQRVQRIKELAGKVMAGDRPLIEDERFREKVAAVEVELKALEMTQMRVLAEDRNRTDKLPNPQVVDPQDQGQRGAAGDDRSC